MAFLTNRISKTLQYVYSFIAVTIAVLLCFAFSDYIDYRITAFLLLLLVSIIAVLFDILPVLFTAFLTAIAWNFFFIPPRFTFHIGRTEDIILFLVYFVIALVNAVLTYKIRQVEKQVRQKEEREHTIRLYNTLLNSLSHELRTPIATIVGATDNLQNFNSKLSESNRYELIKEISRASFRLNQQVENLLNMSRLESGFIKPQKDWCDVTELVHETVKRVEENAGSQRISISISPAIPLFKIDKGMTEQIVYNLLYNAVLYTAPGSQVSISALCHADVLEIIVEDNGPGFPKAEIDKVFDKFYRLEHTKTGGTGLGLSIAKGFAEAQHGRISLENISTGGARFTVDIPAETSYLNQLKNE